MKVAILGSGSWGITLASLIGKKEIPVFLWGREADVAESIQKDRHHPFFATACLLPNCVTATCDLKEAVHEADVIFFVIPSQAMRSVSSEAAKYAKAEVLAVSFAKGFEDQTYKRMSQIIEEEFSKISSRVGVVSGPNHAEEIILGQPAATLAAAKRIEVAEQIREILMGPTFRVYTGKDMIGAELGGALKNVIALAVGIASGLGLGDNPKAALMTRGLAEIARLGSAMGAHPMTFTGLSGVGDLIATCTSEHSRNFRAGRLISKGKTAQEAQQEIGMVVEGIRATNAALHLAKQMKISMPIAEELNQVLTGSKSAEDAMKVLMSRSGSKEQEEYFFQD